MRNSTKDMREQSGYITWKQRLAVMQHQNNPVNKCNTQSGLNLHESKSIVLHCTNNDNSIFLVLITYCSAILKIY